MMGRRRTEREFLAAIERMSARDSRRQHAFLALLPPNYPERRAEREWQAYKALREWWPRPLVRQFVERYGEDDFPYPGILGVGDCPDVRRFLADVGVLAEGQYARTLPEDEMLALLVGADAAIGRRHRKQQSERATKPRKKRGPSLQNQLRLRGLKCVLSRYRTITAERLIEMLEVESLTLDDDDIELRLSGDHIVVRDLKTGAKLKNADIAITSLRKYLSDARNT